MLPKGPLGRQMLTKLKVYAGPDHPHAAQPPEPLDLSAARRPADRKASDEHAHPAHPDHRPPQARPSPVPASAPAPARSPSTAARSRTTSRRRRTAWWPPSRCGSPRPTESYDVDATINGGGITGQAGALRLASPARSSSSTPSPRGTLKKAGFLTRDSREKETKKYGLKKARKAPQYSKR